MLWSCPPSLVRHFLQLPTIIKPFETRKTLRRNFPREWNFSQRACFKRAIRVFGLQIVLKLYFLLSGTYGEWGESKEAEKHKSGRIEASHATLKRLSGPSPIFTAWWYDAKNSLLVKFQAEELLQTFGLKCLFHFQFNFQVEL